MLAYAVRFRIDTIILFYPNTIKVYQEKVSQVLVKDEWADGKAINIYAHQLPIINEALLDGTANIESELTLLFEATKLNLRKVIEGILLPL